MRARVAARALRGAIAAPPSKSMAHRLLLCAALAEGETVLRNVPASKDVQATLRGIAALGARVRRMDGGAYSILGIPTGVRPRQAAIDCGESGSTLRFLVPVAAALGVETTFSGTGQLPSRPLSPILPCLAAGGAAFHYENTLPFTLGGQLKPGRYEIAGDVSSQFITGLLFALAALEGDSEILLTTPLHSGPYVEMTLQAMAAFGVRAQRTPLGWFIPGGQRFVPCDTAVEGDYSGAAFFLCAGAISGDVTVEGLSPLSLQGDRAVCDVLERWGAAVTRGRDFVRVQSAPLTGGPVAGEDIPDILPILAVTAAAAQGETAFTGAARLTIKECDRLAATAALISGLGGRCRGEGDLLAVEGQPLAEGLRPGGTVATHRDHRMAMSAAIAALWCEGPVELDCAECVEKSYPDFFRDYEMLGGSVHVF